MTVSVSRANPQLLIPGTQRISMRYNAGGRPGPGKFTCTTCGWSVQLDEEDEPLPACRNCPSGQNATYRSEFVK